MGNNDELGVFAELPDHVSELAYVGVIERSIYFIQNTEWRRLDQVDGKQKCGCC